MLFLTGAGQYLSYVLVARRDSPSFLSASHASFKVLWLALQSGAWAFFRSAAIPPAIWHISGILEEDKIGVEGHSTGMSGLPYILSVIVLVCGPNRISALVMTMPGKADFWCREWSASKVARFAGYNRTARFADLLNIGARNTRRQNPVMPLSVRAVASTSVFFSQSQKVCSMSSLSRYSEHISPAILNLVRSRASIFRTMLALVLHSLVTSRALPDL